MIVSSVYHQIIALSYQVLANIIVGGDGRRCGMGWCCWPLVLWVAVVVLDGVAADSGREVLKPALVKIIGGGGAVGVAFLDAVEEGGIISIQRSKSVLPGWCRWLLVCWGGNGEIMK